MATQADLVKRVLRRLSVLEGGETPEADDDAVVDDTIADIFAELEENGLAYFELSDIPDAVMPGLIRMVASDVAPEFQAESELTVRWRTVGERMIRRVVSKQGDRQAEPHTYF